ncbi:FCN [Mytilus edulis]|uniref:FCN n=1 Tax=Mytilus edulis TaxID=6550 RepID=A0A8S3UHW8_MYTED|nr:FCN [Mytilus edulis]
MDTGGGGWIVSMSLFTRAVYTIQPEGVSIDMMVYCFMDTDGGGWIVSISLFTSDVYTIQPEGVSTGMMVYCDIDTGGSGWIVSSSLFTSDVYTIQPEGVSTDMMVYCDMDTGNDNLHTLTYSNKYMLRVDLTDIFGNTRYAEYYIFRVSDEADRYRLIIGEYQGDAGDSMFYNNNQIFHTKDQDSTNNGCSLARYAGFWFYGCTWANPNGRWLPGIDSWDSNHWISWLSKFGMSKISMKIRRK